MGGCHDIFCSSDLNLTWGCYSGTSWGAIPFHGVYTSYDYGASVSLGQFPTDGLQSYARVQIAENRELTTKFDEIKRQGMFIRSSPEFYKTDWIADSSTGLTATTNTASFITLLKNPDTGAAFYVARQTDSTSTYVTYLPGL